MSKKKTKTNKPMVQVPKQTIDAMAVFRAEDKLRQQEVKKLTLDGYDNFASRVGLNNDNALSAGTYLFNLVTRNRVKLEATYRGSWVAGAVVDCVAEDMTRAGIDVVTNEQDVDIKDIMSTISRLQINQAFCDGTKWGRLYGGCIGVIQIKGQDPATPLRLETVGEGQFQGIGIYDRWQVNPDLGTAIDSGPDMGLPVYYSIVTDATAITAPSNTTGQIRVHYSRVIRFIGIKLPFFQAQTEMFWGESNLERLWDRLISFDNATMSSASLIDRANLRTVGVEGLREIIAAGGEAQAGLLAMFDMMRLLQVNEGLTLIDKNDTFASTAYSFAGLSDMMLQFGQQIAGATGIPLVRLFGQSPAGLSATGDADIRQYYDNINAQQESRLRNAWELVLKVMWRSQYGVDAPKDLSFTFVPLWQMSAMDKANISKINTETVIGAREAGLVTTGTAMKELRESSGDTGIFSNISDEEIKEAEEMEPPMPDEEESGLGAKPLSVNGKTLSKSDELDTPKDPVKNIDSSGGWFKRMFGKKEKTKDGKMKELHMEINDLIKKIEALKGDK